MVQLLMEYAKKNDIILELNEKNMFGRYPVLLATYFNNLEIVQLLFEYANEHDIQLVFDENDITKLIEYTLTHFVHKEYVEGPKNISKINSKILELWRNYGKNEVRKNYIYIFKFNE